MKKIESKVWLSSPTLHQNSEMQWVKDAFEKNWITTAGDACYYNHGILIRIWNLSRR